MTYLMWLLSQEDIDGLTTRSYEHQIISNQAYWQAWWTYGDYTSFQHIFAIH